MVKRDITGVDVLEHLLQLRLLLVRLHLHVHLRYLKEINTLVKVGKGVPLSQQRLHRQKFFCCLLGTFL